MALITLGANSGKGKILQVVQGTTSTQVSVTGLTFADSGLSASITPSSTSSKILVVTSQNYELGRTNTDSYVLGGFRLLRGSTTIWQPNQEDGNGSYGIGSQISGANQLLVFDFHVMNYLDSPSTLSATTYKTQMRSYTSTGRIIAQKTGSNDNGRSSITLMEISA